MPSPVIATTLPFLCQASIILILCLGSTRAKTLIFSNFSSNSLSESISKSFPSQMFSCLILYPNSKAVALTVNLWSPVTMIGLIPAWIQIFIASLTSFLKGSCKAISPTKVKSLISSSKFRISYFVLRISLWATPTTR